MTNPMEEALKDMPVSAQHHFDNVSNLSPSLRAEMLDYFAAHALQGLLSNASVRAELDKLHNHQSRAICEHLCDRCYQYADQMLREREKWVK